MELATIKQGVKAGLRPPARLALSAVRRVVELDNKADEFCRGRGIEIGALTRPFPFSQAVVDQADIGEQDERREVLDEIDKDGYYAGRVAEVSIFLRPPRFEFAGVADASYDFVYSSHVLEHTPNPLFALSEQLRVVRPGGRVYLVIPNRERTFDIKRATTRLATMVRKYREGVTGFTVEEALEIVENTPPDPASREAALAQARRMVSEPDGMAHIHTFDPVSAAEFAVFCQAEFDCRLLYFYVEGINIHICIERAV